MPNSNKTHSRSNLYRARRKLLKNFDETDNVFSGERTIPENWSRPVLRPSVSSYIHDGSAFKLSVSSTPEPGNTIEVGETIEDLTLHINPVPAQGEVARYSVYSGNLEEGPYTMPVDINGKVRTFYTVSSDCSADNKISIKWQFHDKMIISTWKLSDNS